MQDQLKPITLHLVDITPQPTQRCRCGVKGASDALPLLREAFRRQFGDEGGCVLSLQSPWKGRAASGRQSGCWYWRQVYACRYRFPHLLVLKPLPPTESHQRLELTQTVSAVAATTTKEGDEIVWSRLPSWHPSNHTAWVAPCCTPA